MNMDSMNHNIRNMMNNGRNEEGAYDMSTIEMMNNANNPNNYMLNSTVLTNTQQQQPPQQQNEYSMVDMDKYPSEMLSQMQLEQAMNSYNNSIAMNNGTMQDPNESLYMQNIKSNIDNNTNNNNSNTNSGYESYRNVSNYNNTQNTMQTNQVPMNLEDFNNNEMAYMNQNIADMYPEEFLKSLPNANDNGMSYMNAFQMQNGNFNPMMLNSFNGSPYPMSGYESMNNAQMFMQGVNQKQTRNVPLPNMNQLGQPGMTPSMLPQMQQPSTNIRRVPALNKRKMKPKKFFPCC